MKKTVEVRMDTGKGESPIALMVQTANRFSSSIYLETGNGRVNAKSIMGMMSLLLENGTTVTLDAQGEDAAEALEALAPFFRT